MDLGLQARLLRVLEDGRVRYVGDPRGSGVLAALPILATPRWTPGRPVQPAM